MPDLFCIATIILSVSCATLCFYGEAHYAYSKKFNKNNVFTLFILFAIGISSLARVILLAFIISIFSCRSSLPSYISP